MTTTITAPAPITPVAARRARGRTIWTIAGLVLALVAIAFTTLNVVSGFAFAREHFATPVTEPVQVLEVHAEAGSVHVIAAADGAKTALVSGKGTRGLISPAHDVTITNGRLVVRTDCHGGIDTFCHMNLTVTVPASAVLDLHSDGGGVTVDGPFGDVHASSSGGGVRVRGARGRLSLDSSGGGVNAQRVTSTIVDASSSGGGVNLQFVTPPENVHASSSGGHVTVTVPDTGDLYQVHASSSGGAAHTRVRTDPSGSRVIVANSSGGGVTVQYPQNP